MTANRFLSLGAWLWLLFQARFVEGQGSSFQNLDFESANVSGVPVAGHLPISLAMPGWSAYFGNSQNQAVGYDFISLSVVSISIIDSQLPPFAPLQGNYSAVLQGSGAAFGSAPATISQTGFVPSGMRSLVVDMDWQGAAPLVTLGGQDIAMVPVKTFPTYTLYAGDISSFAGKSATLSFTAPPPAVGSPSFLEVDNIIFSPATVPEPSVKVLFLFGALLLGKRAASRWER